MSCSRTSVTCDERRDIGTRGDARQQAAVTQPKGWRFPAVQADALERLLNTARRNGIGPVARSSLVPRMLEQIALAGARAMEFEYGSCTSLTLCGLQA